MMKKQFIMAALFTMSTLPTTAQSDDRPSQQLITDGTYEKTDNVAANTTFANYPAAIKSLPAMPATAQITSREGKAEYHKTTLMPWYKACDRLMASLSEEMMSVTTRMSEASEKQAAKGKQDRDNAKRMEKVGLIPTEQELMQAIMASGIDMEKADEKQIMDIMTDLFAKKWGISKAEGRKIVDMSMKNSKGVEDYVHTNHPALYKRMMGAAPQGGKGGSEDPRDEAFNAVSNGLAEAQKSITELSDKYRDVRIIENLKNQFTEEWASSDEARQVDAKEQTLAKRLADWQIAYKGLDGEVPYPAWFKSERQQVNAIIDGWNKRAAERWMTTVFEYYGKMQANYDKVTQLDAENEQLNGQGTPDSSAYLFNRHAVLTLYSMMEYLLEDYFHALYFPCVERLPETGSAWFGKG